MSEKQRELMLDSAAIDRIVQNVLKQLSPSRPAARPADAVPLAPKKIVAAAPALVAASASTAAPTGPFSPIAAAPISLADRVITGDLLAEKVKAKGAQLVVGAKAVLTPTALDYIRIHRLELVRSTGSADKKSASGPAASASWKLVVVRSSPAADKLYAELGAGWSREMLGCPDDAATLAITELSRGGVEGLVILATQTHRAACRANRHEAVRAAAVHDAASIKIARTQMRLNVITIDPTSKTYFELRNMFAAFTAPK